MNARQRRQHRRILDDLIGRKVRFVTPGMEWRLNYEMASGLVIRRAEREFRPDGSAYVLGVWDQLHEIMWWVPLRNLRAMSRQRGIW
jgi:hypothetical protein